MKRFVRSCVFFLGVAVLFPSLAESASTESERVAAIQKGLAFLYNRQDRDGGWNTAGNKEAETGAAVLAFLSNRYTWAESSAKYQAAMDRATAYLLKSAIAAPITPGKDHADLCPEHRSSCNGIYWPGNGNPVYTTGLIAPALAAYARTAGTDAIPTAEGAAAGLRWSEIAQQISNSLAASQTTAGGWGPFLQGSADADLVNTQFAVVSLIYNESLGAATPASLKERLKLWLASVQASSGAACFQPGSDDCGHLTTGSWLLAMAFIDSRIDAPALQAALKFINAQWHSDGGSVSRGNFGQPAAMLALNRGLDATVGLNDISHITNLRSECAAIKRTLAGPSENGVACNWSTDYSAWLVGSQRRDGGWPGVADWSDSLASAVYLHILAGTHIPLARPESAAAAGKVDRRDSMSAGLRPAATLPVRPSSSLASSAESARTGVLRPRSRSGITAVDVKPDGTAVASASTDNAIRIWSATTGAQALVLQDSTGLPSGLVFSPDGATVNGVGRDSLLRIWDAVTGAQIQALAGHQHAIRAVGVSPDGTMLATAGEETRVFLWERIGRKLNKILFDPADFVNAVAFSPDSRLLATGGEDARVLVFDIASGRSVFTLLGHSGAIDSVAFSPDGTRLASGGQDTVIHVWDPGSGQQRQTLKGHSAPIRTLAFSPDSRLLASGGEDTQIILWNTATGAIEKILGGSTGAINALAFEPRGRFLASASETGELTLWNTASGTKLLIINVPSGH